MRGFCSKSEKPDKKGRIKKGNRPGFPICSSFTVNYKIHKALAGLLTHSVGFQRLPVRFGMNSGNMLKPFKSLQQRELLPDCTAFPIIRFRNHCDAKVLRLNRGMQ
jgi:hypothetical protein